MVNIETGDYISYNYEADSHKYDEAIGSFKLKEGTNMVSEENLEENHNKEETTMETTLTTLQMMQELTDNGYSFSWQLSDEEIIREYNEMLSDLQAIDAYNSGMSLAEAVSLPAPAPVVPVPAPEVISKEEPEVAPETKCNTCVYSCGDDSMVCQSCGEDGISNYKPIVVDEPATPKPEKEEIKMKTKTLAPVTEKANVSMQILEKAIKIANNNQHKNFISDWMLVSAISEIVIGLPLKGKDKDGKWTEFYKSFTEEQKAQVNAVKADFLKKSEFRAIKDKFMQVVGYVIPAKSLVYGRHKWLGKCCNYTFIKKDKSKVLYQVSLNGVYNTESKKITPMSDEVYKMLDGKCTFIG